MLKECDAVALQGNALHQCGEFHLQPPEKGAEVASVDVSEHRLVLLWSNGVLQAFSQQAAPNAQVRLDHMFSGCLHVSCKRVCMLCMSVQAKGEVLGAGRKLAAITPGLYWAAGVSEDPVSEETRRFPRGVRGEA